MEEHQNEELEIPIEEKTGSDLKTQLEINKLNAEIKHLNKNYFQRVLLPVLIPALITALGTFGTIFILYKSLISSENEKRIDNIYKNNKLVLETYDLTKKKDELRKDIDANKIEQQKIVDSLSILSSEVTARNEENSKLKNLNKNLKTEKDKYQTQAEKIPDTIAEKLIATYLDQIDLQDEFYYTKNPKTYSKFGKVISAASPKVFNQTIGNYVINEKVAWQNRMYVIMVAFNYSKDKNYLIDLFEQNLEKQVCEENRNKEFYKVIGCKEWNEEFYHKFIVSTLRKSNDLSCVNSFVPIINNLRTDTKFTPENDLNAFLTYLNVFKQFVKKKEKELQQFDFQKIANAKYLSSKSRTIILSEMIMNNEIQFLKFIEPPKKEELNKNPSMFMHQSKLKRLYEQFDVSETKFKSIEFWRNLNIENKEIINRLLQDDFKSYKKDKSQLVRDLQ